MHHYAVFISILFVGFAGIGHSGHYPLFYFRRFKKVYFTNVRFLKEIKQETSSRNKLKNLLILLMRCLALAALVFAFAQPYIVTGDNVKKGGKVVSIYIDNSFSMNAEKENIPLIDLAKERAAKIVAAYSEEDRFQILTNDFEGKHLRLVSKEEALGYIDEVGISPASQRLSKIIARQKQVLKGDNKIVYLLSDFQKSITDLPSWTDTTFELNLLPVQHSIQKNISIDSVWFVAPTPILNQTNLLVAKFTNHGDDPVEEVKASIWKDNQEKPIGLISIDAKSSITDTVPITILRTGIHEAEIRINDFPVQFDDKYHVSFLVKPNVKALSVNQSQENKYLNALFKGIGYFTLDNQMLGQIQFQKFKDYDLIILNDIKTISSGLAQELTKYMETGGKVLIMPASDADLVSYNAFLTSAGAMSFQKADKIERKVAEINTKDFVFSEVYENIGPNLRLPTTKLNFVFSRVGGQSQNLLTYRDGSAFITKNLKGEGQLYVCAAPLNQEFNDLVTNAEVFVPMIYKMALAKNNAAKLAYFIGKDKLIEVENKKEAGETVYKLKGSTEFIPAQVSLGKKVILDIKNQILTDGQYELTLDGKAQEKLAFNYDRIESDLDLYSSDEISSLIKNDAVNILGFDGQEGLDEIIGEKDQGIVLWKWFLWAALLFLLLEILLIRFIKN